MRVLKMFVIKLIWCGVMSPDILEHLILEFNIPIL